MTGGNVGLNLTLTGLATTQPANAFTPVSVQLTGQVLPPITRSLSFGADSGLMNLLVAQPRTLQAGASETLDLYDGSLKTLNNEAAAFRQLKWAVVWVISGGDSGGVTVGDAASNPHLLFMTGTTPKVTVYPSGMPLPLGSPAGATVSATVRNVKVLNNSSTALVTYGLLLAGCDTADPPAGTPMGHPLMPLYA